MESTLRELLDKMMTPELVAELEERSAQKANEQLDLVTRSVTEHLASCERASSNRNTGLVDIGHFLYDTYPPEHLSMMLSAAIFRTIDAAKEAAAT